MSSIEPAAVHTETGKPKVNQSKSKVTNENSVDKKLQIIKQSSEKDEFQEPIQNSDLNDVQVNEIPEFTIGPGQLRDPTLQKMSQQSQDYSSKSSPSKDEIPFKSLQNGVVLPRQLKLDSKPTQVLKQNQVQLNQNQISEKKRKLLKKNVFESDMALSTGRFEEDVQQTLSKSANQAKALNVINSQIQEFEAEPSPNLENEMRETSYFKTGNDDTQVKDIIEPITITVQKSEIPQKMEPLVDDNESNISKSKQSTKEGIQMFKISSRHQMKQRRKVPGNINTNLNGSGNDLRTPTSPNSGQQLSGSMIADTPTGHDRNNGSFQIHNKPSSIIQHPDDYEYQRSQSLNYPQQHLQKSNNVDEIDDMLLDKNVPATSAKNSKSRRVKVQDSELSEIQKVISQNEKHETANFGALNIQKQHTAKNEKNNYSALKGGPSQLDHTGEILDNDSEDKDQSATQNQMFTSMSDIGFPANIHNYNKDGKQPQVKKNKEELITADQIQRMMDTQNNWRVRTKTIDEMLNDIQQRVKEDVDYMLASSEKFLDFFVQLLTDQNFKIVLNTLNILNIIIWMPEQKQRFEKLMKQEMSQDQNWGLSNSILGRHIPLIVKKLADSKNIIRQEAIKCLFGINEIMRSGSKKDNNFIALILPYLNNSSNWHIREELLNLLIKCFLTSQDKNEFDSYQILDSILQLFGDTKEKIRNLALEAIAGYASINDRNKMIEIIFQLNVDKDVRELVQSRLEYGMFPVLNKDGNVEIPYQEFMNQNNNYDVDSVAHSVTNQTQISNSNKYQASAEFSSRRKQSIGISSQKGTAGQMRGNSSGRKIVVATANAANQQLTQDEMAYMQSKRTASANNPAQLEFESHQNFLPQNENPANSFSYSVGGNTGNKGNRDQKMLAQFDELSIPFDLNGSSFLPKLQNVIHDGKNIQYSSQHYQRERVVGSSGGPGTGYIGGGNLDPIMLHGQFVQPNMPISGGNKRSNKYLHGTPGHPQSYQAHFSQNGTNLQSQFNRGNSGKIVGNHPMNNSISNKSPSLYDQNTTLFDMSGNVASLFGGENNLQNNMTGQRSGPGNHIKHYSNFGPNLHLNQMSEMEQDLMSVHGAHSNHHHTPSSFNQDQILYSAGGQPKFDMGDVENNSFNLGNPINRDSKMRVDMDMSPSNRNHINVVDGGFQPHQVTRLQRGSQGQIEGGHPNKKYNNQNTFYSDGTTFTGITATTGATSQNRGNNNNKIIHIKGSGPPPHHFQMPPEEEIQAKGSRKQKTRGPGPIKAVRNFGTDSENESSAKPPSAKLKIVTKEIRQDDEQQNRSFSYNKQVNQSKGSLKEVMSAGIPRNKFGSGEMLPGGEDQALMTQQSKVVYLPSEELEQLNKPEKEFKKATSLKQGINSDDWAEQFEACGVIRRVCKHHQSLILSTGNQLQSLIAKLLKLADSLRSAVSRIALITLNDMFHYLKRVMEPLLDPIIKVLLKKGSDTNQFIAQEADKCLISLVSHCQESKVLQILQLQNVNNRSTVYRLKMCFCLQNIVKTLGNNLLFFRENDKLLVLLANYLQDANQEVRQQAKIAFITMSQAIMGQNELEKLLQRVLNEVQYRKVKEFLDKEPTHLITNQGSQIDFVITNANNQNVQNKKLPNKQHQQSFKNLRMNNGLAQKHIQNESQDQILGIQAKQILNPQLAKQDSSGFLTKITQQNKPQFGQDGPHDQFFIDSVKEIILKTQVNEWRLRYESSEQLFDLISQNIHKFSRAFKMVELADAISKLLNDSNAKIQISALENFNKIFHSIFQFVEVYLQIFYKSILSNLGSSNVGVRKNSDQILRQINDSIQDKVVLLQPLCNMIQYNSNARLKPALIEQLIDILDHLQDLNPLHQKHVLPVAFKLLDDNKNEVKSRTEKLLKKLHMILGQQVLDACPQVKLQRVCDICLKNQSMAGTNSSGKASQGGFGANGNQLHLNSRI